MGYDPSEPRDAQGQWTDAGGGSSSAGHHGVVSGHNAGVGKSSTARHVIASHLAAAGKSVSGFLTRIGVLSDREAYARAVAAGKTKYRRGDGVLRIHEFKLKRPKVVERAWER